MFELDFVETLQGLGFGTLVANKPEDIDSWPPFNSLFKLPKLYNIRDEITDEVLINNLDFTTTVKLIKLVQIENWNDDLFVKNFLANEGYFCFTIHNDRSLYAEEQ